MSTYNNVSVAGVKGENMVGVVVGKCCTGRSAQKLREFHIDWRVVAL